MVYRILVASYTSEVYTLEFDPDVPSLTLISSVSVGHHPSWIIEHPTIKNVAITALEQAEGKIIVLEYDEAGVAKVIGEGSTGGADPCCLTTFDGQLLFSNYSSGTFAAVSLCPEPPYIVSDECSIVPFAGTGPNTDRQESSHPHQVIQHSTYNEVLVPDLGADKTRRLVRAADGSWSEQGCVSYKPGSGPRHVAFHDDVLYTVLELTNEVSAHRLPPLPGAPTLLDTVPALAAPPPSAAHAAAMLAAEILVAPASAAFPQPYIYVSNRNDPHPAGDTIAIFSPVGGGGDKMEESGRGRIGYVAEVRTGLQHVRGMAFGGPDGRWLAVGGALGGGVKVFERVEGGRGLREVAQVDVAAPTGFLWL